MCGWVAAGSALAGVIAAGCGGPATNGCTGEAAASAACRDAIASGPEAGDDVARGDAADDGDDVQGAPDAFDDGDATDARAGEACVPDCAGRVCGPDGCGGTCAPDACGRGLACNTADGVCEPTASAMWQITVLDGTVAATDPAGNPWDTGVTSTMRLADPYVCVGRGTATPVCTPHIMDTTAPSWAFMVPTVFGTTDLLNGVLINVKDYDGLSTDDDICPPARVMVTAGQIARGRFIAGCTSAMINFRVDPM